MKSGGDRINRETDQTLARIEAARADGYGIHILRMEEPHPGWIEVEELLESDDLRTALFARVSGLSERPADHICAEWMLENWARAIGDLAGSFMVSHRRLPDLHPANLMIASQKGLAAATAVKSGAMSALESDKKATKRGARPFHDWQAVADQMYEETVQLLTPMVVWIDGHGLRPEKTLWHAAADRIAQSLVWSGKAFDQRDFALELTEYLMAKDGPLSIPVQREEDETREPYHLRVTCCLAYRTPEGGLCRACPLANT
ncbi:MAG: (2Fe-2S)-binding protein [Thermoleophilia bacterium]|nr:(2Fe-2S)-binding protein [Thermoleophilia bacterium]